jgi:hypothetical protein
MKPDKAIEEIRAIRHKISAEYGHDTKALLDHYKELEKHYQDRIISKRLGIKNPREQKQAHQ